MKRGTYTKTIIIPAEDLAFFQNIARKRGWKEKDLSSTVERLLTTPRGKGTITSEEITAEIKAYRCGELTEI